MYHSVALYLFPLVVDWLYFVTLHPININHFPKAATCCSHAFFSSLDALCMSYKIVGLLVAPLGNRENCLMCNHSLFVLFASSFFTDWKWGKCADMPSHHYWATQTVSAANFSGGENGALTLEELVSCEIIFTEESYTSLYFRSMLFSLGRWESFILKRSWNIGLFSWGPGLACSPHSSLLRFITFWTLWSRFTKTFQK